MPWPGWVSVAATSRCPTGLAGRRPQREGPEEARRPASAGDCGHLGGAVDRARPASRLGPRVQEVGLEPCRTSPNHLKRCQGTRPRVSALPAAAFGLSDGTHRGRQEDIGEREVARERTWPDFDQPSGRVTSASSVWSLNAASPILTPEGALPGQRSPRRSTSLYLQSRILGHN